ncbi:hypothetical protein T4B_13359 [Trichinella pseudospiralis]|uniref:Uncharacterized protein n=1 Tax=Trichinella pseudospiralis TaxID=6337 RepID=A0A0V1JX24_TRIPS|nr:hypothetical protein T4A_107 [Trichinella pseudospiralis]KRZ27485.1 hypothetical protein T4B_13359 [Trichinella pseudospiralis]KRZ39432.1 hypothetical protein T4C_5078 [Trichinella pseudospiralis]
MPKVRNEILIGQQQCVPNLTKYNNSNNNNNNVDKEEKVRINTLFQLLSRPPVPLLQLLASQHSAE